MSRSNGVKRRRCRCGWCRSVRKRRLLEALDREELNDLSSAYELLYLYKEIAYLTIEEIEEHGC